MGAEQARMLSQLSSGPDGGVSGIIQQLVTRPSLAREQTIEYLLYEDIYPSVSEGELPEESKKLIRDHLERMKSKFPTTFQYLETACEVAIMNKRIVREYTRIPESNKYVNWACMKLQETKVAAYHGPLYAMRPWHVNKDHRLIDKTFKKYEEALAIIDRCLKAALRNEKTRRLSVLLGIEHGSVPESSGRVREHDEETACDEETEQEAEPEQEAETERKHEREHEREQEGLQVVKLECEEATCDDADEKKD